MDDTAIRQILEQSRVIAVVGLSRDPSKTSRTVTEYMQSKGYTIVPINPHSDTIMDLPAYPSLEALPQEIAASIDLVDIFRPSADLQAVVDESLAWLPKLKGIWAQLGIADSRAGDTARAAGVPMVQNRCIRVEYARLMGV